MVTQTLQNFDSGHTDMVHDTQLDYYGKRIATCSSDKIIKIYDIQGQEQRHSADLWGHEAQVWSIGWAHPKFGSLLASGGFDNKVIVWKEEQEGSWQMVHVQQLAASVNCVAWAPHEHGLQLAAACSDGTCYILYHQSDGKWGLEQLAQCHPMGCLSVSWGPPVPPGALVSSTVSPTSVRQLVTGGCDSTAKVWTYDQGSWVEIATLADHTGWVRDVAWAPSLGIPRSSIATAGQDGKVYIWQSTGQVWHPRLLNNFEVPVWRVSWALTGSILAVSDGNSSVTLWKEALNGSWQRLA